MNSNFHVMICKLCKESLPSIRCSIKFPNVVTDQSTNKLFVATRCAISEKLGDLKFPFLQTNWSPTYKYYGFKKTNL